MRKKSWLRIAMSAFLLAAMLMPIATPLAQAQCPSDSFGMVGRDPWYEFNTDPVNYPDDVNKRFLENMAAEMQRAGARWIRIEFHTEYNQPQGPGYIDWRKYDWFINECAPKYGLKVLALLNSGIISDVDPAYSVARLMDPPDGGGTDPNDGTNNYIRAFRDRARGIADRYGSRIAAYEIFNEPNISTEFGQVTNYQYQELDADRFSNLIVNTYKRLKEVVPDTPVILGGLLRGTPIENPTRTDRNYLSDLYGSTWVQDFYKNGPHYNGNPFPWDGVSIHPYYETAAEVSDHLTQMHQIMLNWGDPYNRIWITEIGHEAIVPQANDTPATESEVRQAQFLRDVYSWVWDQHQSYLGPVFWFKYEDFHETGWGLAELRPKGQGEYAKNGDIRMRKLGFLSYQQMANPGSLPTAPIAPSAAPPNSIYFPETKHSLGGGFLTYWRENGGLDRFGYPLTEEFRSNGYIVQYFQRARFEYHPEFKGTPFEVELGLLGNWVTYGREFPDGKPWTPPAEPEEIVPPEDEQAALTEDKSDEPKDEKPKAENPEAKNHIYFPETRHTLNMGFKYYWEHNGGLAMFGYPISEEFLEVNPADGKLYTVQYFERARFEYHPEHKGTPYETQLGLLGWQMIESGVWYR